MAKKQSKTKPTGLVFKPYKPPRMPFTPNPQRIEALVQHCKSITTTTVEATSFEDLVTKVTDVICCGGT